MIIDSLLRLMQNKKKIKTDEFFRIILRNTIRVLYLLAWRWFTAEASRRTPRFLSGGQQLERQKNKKIKTTQLFSVKFSNFSVCKLKRDTGRNV